MRNYKPYLDAKTRAELEKESAKFNQKEALNELETAGTGAAAENAYEDWLVLNRAVDSEWEPIEANPDRVSIEAMENHPISYPPVESMKPNEQAVKTVKTLMGKLSKREREVAELLMRNLSLSAIAGILMIKKPTVQSIITRIRRKAKN